jgi:hypothetical protein
VKARTKARFGPDVAAITVAVMKRSYGRFDEAFVAELVAGLTAKFEGAPVQDFVEVLVIKEAMDELRRLDELRPAS